MSDVTRDAKIDMLRAKRKAGTLSDFDRMVLNSLERERFNELVVKANREDRARFWTTVAVGCALVACVALVNVAANDWDWRCLVTKCVRVKP